MRIEFMKKFLENELECKNISISPSGLSLENEWIRLPYLAGFLLVSEIASDPDGHMWLAKDNNDGIDYYDGENFKKVWVGSALSICASSMDKAYAILSKDIDYEQRWISSITDYGRMERLPNLPDSEVPKKIRSSSDETVKWVLAESGKIFSYIDSEKKWSVVDNNGYVISQITIGNPRNIWAIGKANNGGNILLKYSAINGWSEESFFRDFGCDWVEACRDGAVFAARNDCWWLNLGGSWKLIENMSDASILLVSSSSSNFLYAIGAVPPEYIGLYALRVGIIDQPAQQWPVQTEGQKKAYKAISDKLNVTSEGGLRSGYNNRLLPFENWYTNIKMMACPEGVALEDFLVIQEQITTELVYVPIVYRLFENMDSLINEIAIINSHMLPAVAAMVGLSNTPADQNAVVHAVLGALFDGVINIMISKIPGDASKAVALIKSCIKAGISAKTCTQRSTNYELNLTYGHLADTMATIYLGSMEANANYQDKILTDWGRLKIVGEAVSSGKFVWPVTKSSEIAAEAKDVYNIFFYQVLMAAKWQLVYIWWIDFKGSKAKPPVMHYVPDYDIYSIITPYSEDTDKFEWWFCGQKGDVCDPNEWYAGPFPGKDLFDAIWHLGTRIDDFFLGKNGWKLSVVKPVPKYKDRREDFAHRAYLALE